jgi:large subunit ribosomal protein L27Ae
MRYFHKTKNQYFNKTINVEKLWTLVDAATMEEAQKHKAAGKALVLDTTKYGITKVLGNGRLPEIPVVVKARFFSKLAEDKIKAAGGACLLTA